MTFLLVKSIPLSEETRDAWASQGGRFLKRIRDGEIPHNVAGRHDFIINLGNLNVRYNGDLPVYNRPDTIRAVSHPSNLRKTFRGQDILPEHTTSGPHWHKNGGYGGRGKVFHKDHQGCAVMGGDSQRHIEGDEFRVITVGDTIVQSHRKHGNLNHFDWEWVGVEGVKKNGIIPLVKKAVEQVPFGARSVFGWDIIVADRPYVLEINTSPGVNEATAERIVRAIQNV